MREVNVMKKRIIIAVVIILFIIAGYLLYWKYPSGRDTMSWARSLRIEDVEKIELIVQPSDENERYKLLSQEEMDTVVKLINKSHGKYVEEPEPVTGLSRLLWLKMRPDTPQHYEYISVEDITGDAKSFLVVKPWTQFFDLKGRTDMPVSRANNVTMRNIKLKCNVFFDVKKSDQYNLEHFTFENLQIEAKNPKCDKSIITDFQWHNVTVETTD